jgi:Tfp pilus assembly protein PilE
MRLWVPTMLSARRQRNHGIAMAELLVAVAIVGFLFIALFLGISFCFSVTEFERENLRATQIVLQRMEGIRLFNWTQLTNTALNPTNFTARYFPGSGSHPASGLTYNGTVTVAPVTLNPTATYSGNMKKVTVTVQWQSGSVSRNRSVSTYVAKDGVQNYIFSN